MAKTNLALVRSAAPSPPENPPPSKQHPKYQFYVNRVRDRWVASSNSEVEVLTTLREFERATIAWKTGPDVKFEDILREERLCPIARYRNFKRAEAIGKDRIKYLGLDAVCLIAKQTHKHWPRLIKLVLDYRKQFGHSPNTQQTSTLIRKVVPVTSSKPTYSQIKRQNETLLQVIRENKLRVPKMPARGEV
jgi:hypothetical protein